VECVQLAKHQQPGHVAAARCCWGPAPAVLYTAAHLQCEGVAELALAHTCWADKLCDGSWGHTNTQGVIQCLDSGRRQSRAADHVGRQLTRPITSAGGGNRSQWLDAAAVKPSRCVDSPSMPRATSDVTPWPVAVFLAKHQPTDRHIWRSTSAK
jgi:hypothetical protein